LAWASGGTELGARHFAPILAERKRMYKVLASWSPPPALGPVPKVSTTPQSRCCGDHRGDHPGMGLGRRRRRRIVGYAASPGVVEGTARVLMNVNEIGDIREGEILVCRVTAPSWGPMFGKIKAAVSDIGGTMSHAAIVAREYGMPQWSARVRQPE